LSRLFSFILLVCISPLTVFAHEGISDQIREVNTQIRYDPKNPELYIKRGELYRVEQRWHAALADYKRASDLDPNLALVDFCKGRMYLDAGQPQIAKRYIDIFLKKKPDHAEGLIVRARILMKLHQYPLAAADFTRAIDLLPEPRPENYIERAQAQKSGGDLKAALNGLDEGIAKLGPLVTLQLDAIELEMDLANYDGALKRLETLAAQSERKETWLARKGEILLKAGRTQEARAAFGESLQAIKQLPEPLRTTKSTTELEAQIKSRLAELN